MTYARVTADSSGSAKLLIEVPRCVEECCARVPGRAKFVQYDDYSAASLLQLQILTLLSAEIVCSVTERGVGLLLSGEIPDNHSPHAPLPGAQ
jgi:hypothetical protein